VTAAQRIAELEAQNARLLDLAKHQATDNQRLLALAERQMAVLEAMAGIEPVVEPAEAAGSTRPCRTRPPARRYRRAQGGAR
jgi:hypothetical protein